MSLSVFLLGFAFFSPSIAYRMVGIDDGFYLESPILLGGLAPAAFLRTVFCTFQQAMYAPLLWCSYALDAILFGASPAVPWGYHATNVLLHAANAALFALLLLHFRVRKTTVFFCAAFWALHPLRVESVAWIAERKDVLSAFFALLSVHAWLCWRRPASPAAHRAAAALLSFLLFAAALTVKVTVAPLPAALLALELWPLCRTLLETPSAALRSAARRTAATLPFFALSVAAAALASAAHGGMGAIRDLPLATRLASVPVHAAFYLLKSVLPLYLAPLHADIAPTPLLVAVSLLLLLLLAVVAVRLLRRAPGVLFGLFVFAVFLFPASGIVRFGIQSVADRFTYLPALGLSVALAALPIPASASAGHRRLRLAAALAILLALSAATLHLLPAWRDSDTLNDRILLCNPNQPHALVGKANALVDAGDPAAALPYAASAAAQRDYAAQAPVALAVALQELGRPADALRALSDAPRQAIPTRQLYLLDAETARALFALGRHADSLAAAERTLAELPPEEIPSEAPYLHLLAMAAAHLAGRPDAALAHARAFPAYAAKTAVADSDLLPFYLSEWRARHRTPHTDAFRALLRASIADAPGTANNLLWGFATTAHSPFPPSEILAAALRLAEAAPSPNPSVLDTLAAAQARAGRFDEASATARRALALLVDIPASPGRDRFEANLRARLALYCDNRPYSEDAFSRWLAQAWGEGLQTTSR